MTVEVIDEANTPQGGTLPPLLQSAYPDDVQRPTGRVRIGLYTGDATLGTCGRSFINILRLLQKGRRRAAMTILTLKGRTRSRKQIWHSESSTSGSPRSMNTLEVESLGYVLAKYPETRIHYTLSCRMGEAFGSAGSG
ncbi:hypothetical protein EVAR_22026_1 [Eumeta japonica]|uniref:Uncharacterized protein n=1 Tax=Eumeta variegata TaxID=151549 RepID=A0A4C1UUC7_EUMVA|nr:hypothetical protein EVAR_22026_1 [Eumeta japonica]